MLTDVAAFSVTAGLIVLLPGPDTLMLLRALLHGGRRSAARSALGSTTGTAIWAITASLGLSALLHASQIGYLSLRIVGGAYLVILGVRAILSHRAGAQGETTGLRPSRSGGLLGVGFKAGLLTDLLNPKVGVFFVTFLPGFVPHGSDIAAVSLLLGAIFVTETAVYLALLVVFSDPVMRLMNSLKFRRRMDRATGVVLIGFGLRLALES